LHCAASLNPSRILGHHANSRGEGKGREEGERRRGGRKERGGRGRERGGEAMAEGIMPFIGPLRRILA
jgi:hypothetical protein